MAQATPAVFGAPARLGNLFDYLRAHASDGRIEAGFVLRTLLVALGPVWPGRMVLDGVPLETAGGTPPPPAAGPAAQAHAVADLFDAGTAGGGLTVTGTDALTGLPEYRNGGLLYDFALMVPRDPGFAGHAPHGRRAGHRRMAGLDRVGPRPVAQGVRDALGLSAEAFPLARVLEGGTGRLAGASPPSGGPAARRRSP